MKWLMSVNDEIDYRMLIIKITLKSLQQTTKNPPVLAFLYGSPLLDFKQGF